MKIDIHVQTGTSSDEHKIVIPSGDPAKATLGRITFWLDGHELEADVVEVGFGVYSILMGGQSHEARVIPAAEDGAQSMFRWAVNVGTRNYLIAVKDPRRRRQAKPGMGNEGPQEILAPMPGKVVKVLVRENEEVTVGAGLLVIEAMKMQNELRAQRSGRVERIYVREAMGVETGSKLLRLV